MVDWLLREGSPVDIEDNQGNTPLVFACMQGHAEVAAHLLRHGARPNERVQWDPLRDFPDGKREWKSTVTHAMKEERARQHLCRPQTAAAIHRPHQKPMPTRAARPQTATSIVRSQPAPKPPQPEATAARVGAEESAPARPTTITTTTTRSPSTPLNIAFEVTESHPLQPPIGEAQQAWAWREYGTGKWNRFSNMFESREQKHVVVPVVDNEAARKAREWEEREEEERQHAVETRKRRLAMHQKLLAETMQEQEKHRREKCEAWKDHMARRTAAAGTQQRQRQRNPFVRDVLQSRPMTARQVSRPATAQSNTRGGSGWQQRK